MKKTIQLLAILITTQFNVIAQQIINPPQKLEEPLESISVFLKVGFNDFKGDLDVNERKPIIGLGIEKRLGKVVSVGLGLDFGSIEGSRLGFNFVTQNSFWQVAAYGKLHLLNLVSKKKQKIEVNPYLGIGIVNFNATSSVNGKVVRFVDGTASSPSSASNMLIKVGVELNYSISKKIKLGLDIPYTG